jgi:superfamily II DNA/RNA helicase
VSGHEVTGPIDDALESIEITNAPSFADLGVPEPLVAALNRGGITAPFPIQAAALPDALAGRDVLGRGQTGSGKTLAFGLPLLARLAGGPAAPKHPRGLVLVPTRELAMQVRDALEPLGRAVGVRLTAVVGGTSFTRQADALRRGVELVIATPGRLTDLIEQRYCVLDEVEMAVLDEADQMCDMGFLPAVTALLDQVAPGGQRMLFSATLDGDVDALVKGYLTKPVTHSTAPAKASVSTMDHHLLYVSPREKGAITAQIAGRDGRTLLFVKTRTFADKLVDELRAVGVRARALHGGKTQAVRTRTLGEFREGRVQALVATDVAARGIHVDNISLVLHVDPPADPKDYLHRAGRTARAGEAGTVVTLVMPRQRKSTDSMARQAGVQPTRTRINLGDDSLAELTGAREPSGTPVPPDPEPTRRSNRSDRPGSRYSRRTDDRRRDDRPWQRRDDRPSGGRDSGDRGSARRFEDRNSADRPWQGRDDRPSGGRDSGDRGSGRRFEDRSSSDRPWQRRDDRPAGGHDSGDRRRDDRPAGERGVGDRPAGGHRFEERRHDAHRTDAHRHDGPRQDGQRFGERRPEERRVRDGAVRPDRGERRPRWSRH